MTIIKEGNQHKKSSTQRLRRANLNDQNYDGYIDDKKFTSIFNDGRMRCIMEKCQANTIASTMPR